MYKQNGFRIDKCNAAIGNSNTSLYTNQLYTIKAEGMYYNRYTPLVFMFLNHVQE